MQNINNANVPKYNNSRTNHDNKYEIYILYGDP